MFFSRKSIPAKEWKQRNTIAKLQGIAFEEALCENSMHPLRRFNILRSLQWIKCFWGSESSSQLKKRRSNQLRTDHYFRQIENIRLKIEDNLVDFGYERYIAKKLSFNPESVAEIIVKDKNSELKDLKKNFQALNNLFCQIIEDDEIFFKVPFWHYVVKIINKNY